ncbi:MAG: glycosyltransferase family 2 protein [Candidatus Staskawiczbacteria bacterium]|nr:glycosyltransferase family 2 protein [Candidatus Staskawiczbacteria bacterium]
MKKKNNKPLISIAIPTYNRAVFLQNLLSHIAPEANELEGIFQICISNNCSTDNTSEVVAGFQTRYPGLISYNENSENLGYDGNVLKIMEMSDGEFVWLLGDDDMIVDGGFKKVINFIKDYCDDNTGIILLGHESYCTDEKNGKEIAYFDTIEETKPKMYKTDIKDIIGIRSNNSFLSILLLNNKFLKKILKEENAYIAKAVTTSYIHVFIYQLMLLKYQQLEVLRFNEAIIHESLHCYKYYVEDKFSLYYVAWKKLDHLLLASKYVGDFYRRIITGEEKKIRRRAIKEMGSMKAFDTFNYHSFIGCVKLFFRQATWMDAFLVSFFFIIFLVTPSIILKEMYKTFVKAKYREKWQKVWLHIVVSNSMMSKGSRRLVF